jgi:HEAT repeat protein
VESVERIEQAIADLLSPEPEVAGNAWRQLVKIGRACVPYIAKAMKSDNPEMRARAAEVFCTPKLRDPEAVDALVDVLKDPVSGVRLVAIQSLARQMDPRACDALVGALEDAEGLIRGAAMSTLADLKYPRAFDVALSMLKNDPDVDARWGAAHALARLQDARSLPPLLEMLADKNDEDRIFAAQSLAWTADARAIPALTAALNDPNRIARRAAKHAIDRVRDEAVADN